MIGERILHFEISGELGRGGMGEVYKAWDLRLERVVALKFLSATQDPLKLRPLIEEAIAASRLNVDSVVKIHADYDSPAGPFLCMEYLPEGSLRDRIDRGSLPLVDVLRVGLSVAKALEAAHGAGILHCDLKPGNVLLTGGGAEAAKVTDFGLAQMMRVGAAPGSGEDSTATDPRAHPVARNRARRGRGSRAKTVTLRGRPPGLAPGGFVAGTPGYMSPEQQRGEALDHRSDLYALGVLLYEMATGVNPLRARGRAGPRRDRSRPFSAASGRRRRGDFPPAYWRLVESLTASDVDRRPRGASTVVRVLGRLLTRARAQDRAAPAAGAAPLFGRDAQRELLAKALGGLFEGRGSAWLIEGAQGSGKTALAEALRRDAVAQGAVVLAGSCLPRETSRPYLPLLEAVEGFVHERGAGEPVERLLQREVGLASEAASFLGSVLGSPARAMPRLGERVQPTDALRGFLLSLARERSVVLLLDDLHLADPATTELFTAWARAAREIPLLLLGTFDPEAPESTGESTGASRAARDRLLARGVARPLVLPPLDRPATERLLASLLPMLPAGHRGFDQVYWRTGGLPGFVVEIARLAQRAGTTLAAIERALGGVMPDSIRASLTLRIEQLDPRDVELLRAAAVAGDRFAPSVLDAAGFGDGEGLFARLETLEREHHLLRREDDDRHRFANPQVREFLLSTLHPGTRRELHGRLADALLAREKDVPPEVLARHLLGAGRSERAGGYLRAAAESALTVFAETEALRFADLAERNLPAGRKADALRRDVHLIRALALESLGHYTEAHGQAEHAVRLARRADSKAALGEALVALGWLQHQLGRSERAERTLRSAETHCRAGRNPRGLARSLLNRGHLRYQRGKPASAATLYRKALAAARRSRDPIMIARTRANLSNVQVAQQQLERAAEGYRAALESYRLHGDVRTAAVTEGNLGLIRLKQGRFDEARELCTASLRTREEIGDRRGVAAMEVRLARCALALGNVVVAAGHAERTKKIAGQIGDPRLGLLADLLDAEGLLAGGARARAEKRLRALAERARTIGETFTVNVLEALVRAHLARRDLDAAAKQARRARTIASRLGNPADQTTIDRVYARVLLARRRFRDVLRVLESAGGGAGSARASRRGRGEQGLEPDVENRLEMSLMLAAASEALSRKAGDAHARAARAARERAEMLVARVTDALGSSVERQRYAARWRREARRIRSDAGLGANAPEGDRAG